MREMQHNAPADRAAHDNGFLKLESVNDVKDQTYVVRRSQLIFTVLPAGGGRSLAMPWHVESNHTKVAGDAFVVEQAAILAGGGTRRVRAEQRNAFSRFLNIQAMRFPQQIPGQIPAGDCFALWGPSFSSRSAAWM